MTCKGKSDTCSTDASVNLARSFYKHLNTIPFKHCNLKIQDLLYITYPKLNLALSKKLLPY